ncbi:AraC family ligand binding domain-containing protein [Vibrio sp. TRT 17S01]|uniref:helix-turn-helix domain-containing protein n=1 Tax=Vibrio sp. TRT 17S01 TaxID=3418505 RepID=UPI003CEEF1D7
MDQVSYHNTHSPSISLIEASYQRFAFSRHYHLDLHIGLITQGQQKFHYQGSSHRVNQGQLVIMQPDELHDGQSILDSGYQTKIFSIDPLWFSDLADPKQSGQIISFNQLIISDPDIFSHLCNFHRLLNEQSISQLAKDCLPFEGLTLLLDRFGSFDPRPSQPLGKKSISLLKEYLLANLDQAIRLEQLAQLCQLSPTQFQRHFKAQMGMTPYAWLSRLRLEQAMKLLKAGISGTEVAHQVGYYDQAHFSKAFKLSFGISPSQVN